ncbi:aminotransferase [Psychromarinibacter sp. C21-152]|uniref:Glutamine--fructose-6-phosphate aminotransferase [isomerizing] n=1 Tax=Psychromarinibacter sediminicola TaxID=3033385 RepID=A0AAE3NVE5_9RHOB|nr:aminotransferase [Psychromarinibacter sediminicola]MDF0602746.1 aminotransferase [Psychromarinibacter sediminicola]
MTTDTSTPPGLLAIRDEMARQHSDALASFRGAPDIARRVAGSVRETGRLLLLGMGASHAAGRAVAPIYRSLGIDALALPLSEQLYTPLPVAGRTVMLTSQSGESAEVLRWLDGRDAARDLFGLTMESGSTLARAVPSLLGAGGTETAFAATRSLMVTLALHAAVLGELGADTGDMAEVLGDPRPVKVGAALDTLAQVDAVVTSGRRLQGLAEAIALGLTELSRRPCFAMEGGQLRHGPMEMLGAHVGVVMFRGKDGTADLVGRLATETAATGAPTVVFDASGAEPVEGATTVGLQPAADLGALFRMLPAAQAFMVEFAVRRVADVGTPIHSSKVTRVE